MLTYALYACYCWYFLFPQVYTNWKFPSIDRTPCGKFLTWICLNFFTLKSFWHSHKEHWYFSTLTRCCVSFIYEFSLMQFMIISSVVDNVFCLPHNTFAREKDWFMELQKRMKYFNANQSDVLLETTMSYAFWEAGVCLYVSHRCEIIIEFVYCSRVYVCGIRIRG